MNTKTIIPLLIASVFAVIVSTKGTRHPDCLKPLDTDLCQPRISKWGFDITKKKCIKFSWGGCNENPNRFETENECNAKCGDKSESAAAKKEFVTVTGTCNCQCPKCGTIPSTDRKGSRLPTNFELRI